MNTMHRDELLSRVRIVRNVRALMSSPLSGAFFAAIFIVCTSILVSIGDVMHNIMVQGDWSGRFSYTYSSLIHSRIAVQALALLIALSCFMILARSIRHIRIPIYFVGNLLGSISPLKFFRS